LALAGLLHRHGNDPALALPAYSGDRLRFGRAVVAHARELGAYLQACDRDDAAALAARARAAHRHTPAAVMRDIAVTREF
jgi:hypothetical protein